MQQTTFSPFSNRPVARGGMPACGCIASPPSPPQWTVLFCVVCVGKQGIIINVRQTPPQKNIGCLLHFAHAQPLINELARALACCLFAISVEAVCIHVVAKRSDLLLLPASPSAVVRRLPKQGERVVCDFQTEPELAAQLASAKRL